MIARLIIVVSLVGAAPVDARPAPGGGSSSDSTVADRPAHVRPKKKKRNTPRKPRRHHSASATATSSARVTVAPMDRAVASASGTTAVESPQAPATTDRTTGVPVALASTVQPVTLAPPPEPVPASGAIASPAASPGIAVASTSEPVSTASTPATTTTVVRAGDHVDVVVAPSAPVSSDSLGIIRIGPRLVGRAALLKQLELSIGGGMTYATQGATVLEDPLGAARLRWLFGRFSIDGGLAVFGKPTLVLAPSFNIAGNLLDGFRVVVGVHHRPFIEVADALATDEQAFHNAGVGGASDLAAASTLTLNELELLVNLAPWPWLYLYADGKGMSVSDGNHGFTVATGTGINLFGVFGWWSPLQLYARWDTYLVGFRASSAAYYSPSFFDGDGVGAELRWKVVNALELSANGGRTLSFATGGSGWFYGAGLDLRVGSFSLQARGAMRDEIYFVSRRVWVGATMRF
jgi:hypothetical protein